jgi:signal transduction histidine kinase
LIFEFRICFGFRYSNFEFFKEAFMDTIQAGQGSSGILVIEDNVAQLRTLLDILETEGLQPIACQTGKEALVVCQEHDIHVAILDLRLPDMDGLDVLSQLKDQTPDMKVIINTAYATLESAMEAVNKEAYAYVQKMGDIEELLVHVHRAFHAHLAGYSEHLEGEVRKRTAELVAANTALRQEIAERKRVEEALQKAHDELEQRVEERTAELRLANAELARASRLKDEFLANMSHELRTPLTVILGMSESLREAIYGPLNERQLRSLRMVEDSGRHLLTLITDILNLSKIGAGKLELDLGPVFVESICHSSLEFIKQNAQKKQLTVSSMFDNAVTHIHADGRRLKQILVNLLSNAVKFTPEGGEIGLEVESDPERGAVHLTVWDTGIGIAREDMEHLFQPFVQVDASLSRKYSGAGLGLSLVYRMVEMHGGSVSVESEVGTGSRFTVSLPWQESGDGENRSLGDGEFGRKGEQSESSLSPHPPIPPSPHLPSSPSPHLPSSPSPHLPSSPSPQSTTILIAEDNDATITTLSGYLSAKGYHVLLARDGWEAFTHTREHQPDLIVMDIQMPDMDGLEAIRHIRSDPHSPSIPIIALTALAMPGDREKCLAAGADEYLSKPVSLQKLSDILEKLFAKQGHEQQEP